MSVTGDGDLHTAIRLATYAEFVFVRGNVRLVIICQGGNMVMKVKVSPGSIAGDVNEGYGKLADVFRRNMASGQEIGAAVAVYRDGAKVVDLWGGYCNGITKAPWQEDTAVTVFSTTKGVSALAVAVAASQGLISYDAKVADYWPEFAQGGKGSVSVRQLLSHQAGLPVLDQPLTLDDLAEPAKMSAKIAAQPLCGPPGNVTAITPSRLAGMNPNSFATPTPSAVLSAAFLPRRSRHHLVSTSISGCPRRWTATG